jgi:hypothetical protein
MKKLMIVVLMLLSAVSLFSQDWGTKDRKPETLFWLAGHLEAGYCPLVNSWDYSDYWDEGCSLDAVFYADFGATAHFMDWLFLGGYAKTWVTPQDKNDNFSFNAFMVDYGFFFGVKFKGLEVGFRHFCTHPVNGGTFYSMPLMEDNRAYEEIYIRLEF